MQRMLVAVAAVAFVIGRYTAPAVEAKPVVTVRREVQPVTVEAPPVRCPDPVAEDEPDDDPGAIDVTDTEAMRLVVEESQRIARIDRTGSIRGQIRDSQTGENLAGVTVVASGGAGTQTAITDENGWYQIAELEPTTYLVTLYYLDRTVEYPRIAVESRQVTPLSGQIESSSRDYYVRTPPPPPPPPDDLGISFSGGTRIDNVYFVEE